jgi:hypothetical protein
MTTDASRRTYTVWIEAEQWPAGAWHPEDANTDVIVRFEDGARWYATFVAYRNVATLTAKNRQSGECLSGKYLWISDMILVDEVSRVRIEEVVAHLMEAGEFEQVFTKAATPPPA